MLGRRDAGSALEELAKRRLVFVAHVARNGVECVASGFEQ
jgi:hypothetical protein